MRDYSKVGPKFWIGATGKRLRAAGMEAQIVAMYLLTSPHANMLGLYYCPVMFIAHETGLGLEGASKGLQSAIEAGFCEYDEASEVVWVIEMASYQVGEALQPKDLRVKGVQNEYTSLPENPYLMRFYEKYGAAFHMESCRGVESPLEAPYKPLRSQEQEKEQEQEQKKASTAVADPAAASPSAPPSTAPTDSDAAQPASGRQRRGTRLPDGWMLPKSWGEWALGERPDMGAEDVRKVAECFADYWHAKAGKDACKTDWEAAWRLWVRREPVRPSGKRGLPAAAGGPVSSANKAAGEEWLRSQGESNEPAGGGYAGS